MFAHPAPGRPHPGLEESCFESVARSVEIHIALVFFLLHTTKVRVREVFASTGARHKVFGGVGVDEIARPVRGLDGQVEDTLDVGLDGGCWGLLAEGNHQLYMCIFHMYGSGGRMGEGAHTSQCISIFQRLIQVELALLKCLCSNDEVHLVLDVVLLLVRQRQNARVLEACLLADALDVGLGGFDVVEVLGVGVYQGFCFGSCFGYDLCHAC